MSQDFLVAKTEILYFLQPIFVSTRLVRSFFVAVFDNTADSDGAQERGIATPKFLQTWNLSKI